MLATKTSATLSATLEQTGGAPLRGKPLILTLGAGGTAQSCPASTDAAGEAACTVTIAQPLGPGTVSAAFAGDDAYEPSNDSQKTLVYAYSSGGSFVVGAPGTVGSSVTFWSARWGQRNPLAGGAPAAFKGFENDPARPSCGAPWTSQPGNSSGPPSTVHRYVAVIVSARVTQSGAKVNGDTVHVAIVHTDSGYAASPGHPGTGTVVALIC
ncbi:MAG: hypothetical protein M3417_12200 [Actinomycetota bacterium]|nr:hypothetical protein [Actinomycetota bacterium]